MMLFPTVISTHTTIDLFQSKDLFKIFEHSVFKNTVTTQSTVYLEKDMGALSVQDSRFKTVIRHFFNRQFSGCHLSG